MNKDFRNVLKTYKGYFVGGFVSTMGGIAATELVALLKDPVRKTNLKNKFNKIFKKEKDSDSNIIKLRD